MCITESSIYSFAHRRFCTYALHFSSGDGAIDFCIVFVAGHFHSAHRAIIMEQCSFLALTIIFKKADSVLAFFIFFDFKLSSFFDAIRRSGIDHSDRRSRCRFWCSSLLFA